MKKLWKKLSIGVLIIIVLLGMGACTSNPVKQLKDQTLVQGIGVDMSGEDFEITFQVLDISKSGVTASDSKGTITTTYSSTGSTISQAVANGQKVLDRETFLAQNKIIVLNKEVAEKHMNQVLDFFIRSRNCRPDVQVAVTDDPAKEIMKSTCKDAVIPAEKIQKMLINGEYNGKSATCMIMEVVNDYVNPTSTIYLPVVKLFDEGENVSLSGVTVFAEDRYAFSLDDDETRGLLWAVNHVRNGTMVIHTDKLGQITLRIVRSRSKSKVQVKDEQLEYHLSVKCYVNINEMEEGIRQTINEDDFKEIQEKAEAIIKNEVESVMKKCLMEHQSDVFNIGRKLSQKKYSYYKKIKDSYQSELPFVKLHITPEVEIKRLDNEALKS